jgi:uncharacterized membrane protein HdeD (DUF308 family)
MRSEVRMHRVVLAVLAFVTAAFVALLLYVHPTLEYERLEAIASLILVAVAAAAFVSVGAVEETIALIFGKRHKRELLSYLLLGSVSIASGLFLAFSKTASLQTIAFVVAPHALLFGAGELRMAQHLSRHPVQKRSLYLCGLCELALGIALACGWMLSTQDVSTLLGLAAIVSLLQLLPLLLFNGRLSRLGTQ